MRDEIDIFIDSTLAWSEHRQALVLSVDKHQFERALRDLMDRARIDGILTGERLATTGDQSNDSV
jgi:acetone carboxylase gamma subunit